MNNCSYRAGSKLSKGPTQATHDDKPLNGVTHKINDLVLNDVPKAKSKNLDVLAEYDMSKSKKTANFVVIGDEL